jgi:hypothetical protein
MRTLYIEGLAIHGGPDHALATRKGAAKRWVGVGVGWAIEQRNQVIRGADVVFIGGRQHRWRRYRELLARILQEGSDVSVWRDGEGWGQSGRRGWSRLGFCGVMRGASGGQVLFADRLSRGASRRGSLSVGEAGGSVSRRARGAF